LYPQEYIARVRIAAPMKRGTFFLLLAIALGGACSLPARSADAGHITVFAAASLKEAFTNAAGAFTKSTGTDVTFNFAGSDTLATQIAQGAPADVFASANTAQMKKVVDGGSAAGAPVTFARNTLVVIVPKANPAGVTDVRGLAKPGTHVVLAAPTVPIGAYARTAFKNLATQGYPADFADEVEKNVVSNELDVKAVATKVALGEADAGVVYSTDVTADVAPKVTVIPLPHGAVPDAIYPIVALKGAANATGADAFVKFIMGDGQTYLRARGFLAP
jgi:molybdate transport system substrate-binding protein